MYALANKHYHVVGWLESQGAKQHIGLNYLEARQKVDRNYDAWIN